MKRLFLFSLALIAAHLNACDGPIQKPAKPSKDTETAAEKEKNQKARRLSSFLDAVRKPALTFSEIEQKGEKIVVLNFDDYQDPENTAWQMSLEEAKLTIFNVKSDLAKRDEFVAKCAAIDAKGSSYKLDETEKKVIAEQLFSYFNMGKELKKLKKDDKKSFQIQEKRLEPSFDSEKLGKLYSDMAAAKQKWRNYKQIKLNRDLYVAALLMGDKELIDASLTFLDVRPLWADQKYMVPLSAAIRLAEAEVKDPTDEFVKLGIGCPQQ